MASSAPRKHLRLVVSTGDDSDATVREFAVRFTKEPGRLAWLHKPSNQFGWTGTGLLRFDERGLEITARRLTVFGPRRMRRMLHAAEIRDAGREGAAIRITLRDGARRHVLPLWTENAAAATQIMALLPTSRTVEVDGVTAGGSVTAAPATGWLLAAAAAVVLAIAWAATGRFAGAPPRAPPRVVVLPIPQAATGTGDELQRAVAAAADADVLLAWGDLQRFLRTSDALEAQFRAAFNALLLGGLSQEDFANKLERWLGPQWRVLEQQLPAAGPMSLRLLADDQLRAVSVNWQRALELYKHGLRSHDVAEVTRAFDSMRIAEQSQVRAQALLEQIERRHRLGAAQRAHGG